MLHPAAVTRHHFKSSSQHICFHLAHIGAAVCLSVCSCKRKIEIQMTAKIYTEIKLGWWLGSFQRLSDPKIWILAVSYLDHCSATFCYKGPFSPCHIKSENHCLAAVSIATLLCIATGQYEVRWVAETVQGSRRVDRFQGRFDMQWRLFALPPLYHYITEDEKPAKGKDMGAIFLLWTAGSGIRTEQRGWARMQ